MAGNSDRTATFSINLETNAGEVSADAASELEQLRQKIYGSNEAVRQMGAALRSLRGSSEQVKSAKAELKAKIDAERDAISSANLKLLEQGVTYEKLAGKARKLEAAKKAQAENSAKALHMAGGPLQSLVSRFEQLKEVVSGAGGKFGAFTLVAAGTAAALAAVTAAVLAAGVALVRFIVEGADAARSANLVREAFTGSAVSARNLGTQVDALASKVPTSKDQLNQLAAQLTRTRMSGGAIVDTFNIVGQASAAMGDDVGRTLQDIVTRGQMYNRFRLNPLELQGTGLKFTDVAQALAKQMGVGVKQAQAALYEGRVKLDDGAKALRTAVEKRFGQINAEKMLSLGTQAQKIRERLIALTSGVNLEPLLRGFDELSKLFDSSTVTGSTLKTIITLIGNSLGPAFQAVLPIAKKFFQGMIIATLDMLIAFFRVKNAIKKTFGGSDVLGSMFSARDALNLGKAAVYGLAAAFAVMGVAVAVAMAPIWVSALALYGLYKAGQAVWDKLSSIDWGGLGSSIIDGLVNGLKSGASALSDAVTGLASKVKDGFKDALGIHSPSRVFAQFGQHSARGFAIGIREQAPVAASATRMMARASVAPLSAPAPSASISAPMLDTPRSGTPGAGGGRQIVVHVGGIAIHASGEKGHTLAKQAEDPSFVAALTKAFEDALATAGLNPQGAT